MTIDKKIFHEIPRSADRDQLLADFAKLQCDLFIKFSDHKTLLTKVKRWLAPFKLQLEYPKSLRPLVQNQVPIQINHRGDRFFAQAFILDSGSEFFVVIEGPLYKVQRRQGFRIRLPAGYYATTEVFELNGHKVNGHAQLKDISEGGCSIQVSHELQCEMGSYIGLNLKIGDRTDITQYGHVRFSKMLKKELDLGIQFIKNSETHPHLTHLVRDLYAELFSKWYKRR